jgi:CheY-like chemotaxis protein
VSDTGVGIDPEFLPHIFDRFAQEDSSSTRTYGGLGLGLSIVRHLVEIHGGTVKAQSPGKGQGATMSVTLPLVAGDAGARAAPPPVPPDARAPVAHDLRLGDARILVVDDDAATRDAIAEMLHQRGASVSVAGSAGDAMAAVEKDRPEVIVCDIAMPGEDGYDFMRRLRSLGSDTPAVALTALAGPDDQRQALASGFQLHLAKPVDSEQLIAAVAALRAGRAGPGA